MGSAVLSSTHSANARILWAVMTKGEAFDARHVSVKPGAAMAATAST
jgi:hypothetical protein